MTARPTSERLAEIRRGQERNYSNAGWLREDVCDLLAEVDALTQERDHLRKSIANSDRDHWRSVATDADDTLAALHHLAENTVPLSRASTERTALIVLRDAVLERCRPDEDAT